IGCLGRASGPTTIPNAIQISTLTNCSDLGRLPQGLHKVSPGLAPAPRLPTVFFVFDLIADPEILHAFQELAFESSAIDSATMKRLAAMRDCPFFNPGFHCPCNRRLQIRAGNNVKCTKVGY